MSKYKYGWIPSKPHNAKLYSLSHNIQDDSLPQSCDLRDNDVQIYDQGQLGSCTANGIAGIIQFIQPNFMPSRLFIYYNERDMEGDINDDAGGQIHDGIISVVNQGVVSETEWPYDISQFAVKPSNICYNDAKKDLITDYMSLTNIDDIRHCLAAGFPVVFGTTVFNSFESDEVAQTGIVPMPHFSDG